jgi:hypothetical protein
MEKSLKTFAIDSFFYLHNALVGWCNGQDNLDQQKLMIIDTTLAILD